MKPIFAHVIMCNDSVQHAFISSDTDGVVAQETMDSLARKDYMNQKSHWDSEARGHHRHSDGYAYYRDTHIWHIKTANITKGPDVLVVNINAELLDKQRLELLNIPHSDGITTATIEAVDGIQNMLDEWSDEIYHAKEK